MEDVTEDESLVVIDLAGILEHDFLSQVKDANILGLDSEKPLLQLDHYVFSGEYQDALGTCLLLEEKTDEDAPTDDNGRPQQKLEYHGITYKRLGLERVFLKKKLPDAAEDDSKSGTMDIEPSTSGVTTAANENTIKLPGSEDDIKLSCDSGVLNSDGRDSIAGGQCAGATESITSGRLTGEADVKVQETNDAVDNPAETGQQLPDLCAVVVEKLQPPDG